MSAHERTQKDLAMLRECGKIADILSVKGQCI